MEEERITIDEQTEHSLTREEILERSRKENSKTDDEREQELVQKGNRIALIIGWGATVIAWIFNMTVLHRNSPELIAIIALTAGINLIWTAKVSRKNRKIYLIIGIFDLIGFVANLVLWILMLFGVK